MTTATRSALITGLVVVFVPIFSLLPFGSSERPDTSRSVILTGALLAFVGVGLLTTAPGTGLTELWAQMNGGDLLTVLCAIAFAGHLLFLARVSARIAPGLLATVQIGSATVLMVLSIPFSAPVFVHVTKDLVIAWLITGLLATSAAFTVQSWAQRHIPATHTAVLLSLEPVFALITARVFLGEQLSRRALLGAGFILLGIAVIELLASSSPIAPEPMA